MFGVVLWSDTQAKSAVIWCEDHGDLAFYKTSEPVQAAQFDAGDWVQFDVALERQQRLAVNPRLVAEGLYPELADQLSTATPENRTQGGARAGRVSVKPRRTAEVIPFGARKSSRDRPAQESAAAGNA